MSFHPEMTCLSETTNKSRFQNSYCTTCNFLISWWYHPTLWLSNRLTMLNQQMLSHTNIFTCAYITPKHHPVQPYWAARVHWQHVLVEMFCQDLQNIWNLRLSSQNRTHISQNGCFEDTSTSSPTIFVLNVGSLQISEKSFIKVSSTLQKLSKQTTVFFSKQDPKNCQKWTNNFSKHILIQNWRNRNFFFQQVHLTKPEIRNYLREAGQRVQRQIGDEKDPGWSSMWYMWFL